MFEQVVCPYFVCSFGYMNSITLKNYGVTVEEFCMGIEKAASGLGGYCLNVSVKAGNSVIWKVGKVHREQAVDKNLCQRIVFSKLDDYVFQRVNKSIIIGQQVIGAYHYHDNVDFFCPTFYIGKHLQKFIGYGAWYPEVLNTVQAHTRTPVIVCNE